MFPPRREQNLKEGFGDSPRWPGLKAPGSQVLDTNVINVCVKPQQKRLRPSGCLLPHGLAQEGCVKGAGHSNQGASPRRTMQANCEHSNLSPFLCVDYHGILPLPALEGTPYSSVSLPPPSPPSFSCNFVTPSCLPVWLWVVLSHPGTQGPARAELQQHRFVSTKPQVIEPNDSP